MALDTVADFLQRELGVRRRKVSDWRKFYLFERLDFYLRFAGMKGEKLHATIAALVDATFGTAIKIASGKPLLSKAKSLRRRVDRLREGSRKRPNL